VSFIEELKRRNVFRVGIAYVLLGWVVLQAADFALDIIDAPNWIIQALLIVGLAGLPIALFFAWAFEITPEGIKREADVDRTASVAPQTRRKLDRAIIVFLVLVVVGMGVERFYSVPAEKGSEPFSQPSETSQTPSETPPLTTDKSVAVLAFDNMSPDPENEYFADGISEEILNVLAGLDNLRVIARTSAFSFKGSEATVAEIAEKLDVGYVLEGSVRRSGNRVRVTAQLIDTADESHLWSDTYDRDLDDIFAVQDEIARAIAGELELQLTPDQQVALVEAPTKNLEAYNKYLQGRQLWHSRGVQNLQVSAALLEQAVTLDPDFAEAWAALADSWLLIPEYSESRSTETIPRARDAVNRALELKPGMPEALTTRAYIRFIYDFDWVNAERDFQRALELDPGYATAQQWYGEFLAIRDGDIDGALAQVMKAAQLDPLAPVMWNVAGFITAWAGRFEESIGYYRRTLEIEPGFDAAYANLAYIHLQTGNFEAARKMWRRSAALTDDSPDEFLRFIDAMEDPTLRPAYLESLEDSPFWVSGAVDRASAYMMLGDADRAMTDLEQSLEAGYPYATHVNRMAIYDPLRETPRFQAHLAKMNLWPPPE